MVKKSILRITPIIDRPHTAQEHDDLATSTSAAAQVPVLLPPAPNFTLDHVDKALSLSKPPSVEYIFVEVLVNTRIPCHFSHFGRWGHSAVRYTLPDGRQRVVNITRPEETNKLMEVYDQPGDYILGKGGKGGIFSRDMVGVRIENVAEDSLWALHYFFESCIARFKADPTDIRFELTGGVGMTILRELFILRRKPTGNCARWTSRALEQTKLVERSSLFPKKILIEMLELAVEKDPDNVHVVYYNRIHATKKEKSWLKTGFSFHNPMAIFLLPSAIWRSLFYWDLRNFADVIVDNDEGHTPEELGTNLVCTMTRKKGRRLSKALKRLLSVLDALYWIGLLFGYNFICADFESAQDYEDQYLRPGLLTSVCEASFPRWLSLRLLITLSLVTIYRLFY